MKSKKPDSTENFEDGDSYSYNFNKDNLTFKDIVLQHLKKITIISSVEFQPGFWEDRPIMVGGAHTSIRIYHADTREVYSNAVQCFADMLFPYFDEEMKQEEEKYQKLIEDAFEDFTELVNEEGKHFERRTYLNGQKNKINYRILKRQIYQSLFRCLCSFLYRKKYLELGTIED